jgi:hypothetical protein
MELRMLITRNGIGQLWKIRHPFGVSYRSLSE